MGHKKNISINIKTISAVLILLVVVYFLNELRYSLVFNEKDRINIGVYGDRPYVYSYNPGKNLAFVVHFDPDYLVNVPGGYGWYKLSSLWLLGKIEKNQADLLRQAFGELIGSPVDYVYYPKKEIKPPADGSDFDSYYQEANREILGKNYRNSVDNLFDRVFIRRIFRVRVDHLVFLDTSDLFTREKDELRYDPEVLDGRLKGLFYHDSILRQGLKTVLVTNSENYASARRLLRQVEGMGIKVIDIRIEDTKPMKPGCRLASPKQALNELGKFGRLFGCKIEEGESRIVEITIGSRLAKKFKYNK